MSAFDPKRTFTATILSVRLAPSAVIPGPGREPQSRHSIAWAGWLADGYSATARDGACSSAVALRREGRAQGARQTQRRCSHGHQRPAQSVHRSRSPASGRPLPASAASARGFQQVRRLSPQVQSHGRHEFAHRSAAQIGTPESDIGFRRGAARWAAILPLRLC